MKDKIKKALKIRRWLTLAHHIPGRIRLKYKMGIMAHLVTIKVTDIEQALADIPAFKNYKINSDTGSILIEYDAGIIKPEFINQLFSESEVDVQQAYLNIAASLKMDGVNDE
ncbi:cation transporter [Moritella sp. 5]|nr:cation transporter [Moritella sp. 5]